jgi:hypothetical protein
MPTEVMINGLTQRYETDVITIGRGAENTIALPHDQRLAPNHAVLKSVSGRWIVESKEGGALRVGSGRPTQFAWINPGDVIHLTDSGPDLVFEPGKGATSTATGAVVSQAAAVSPPSPTTAGLNPAASGRPAGQQVAVPSQTMYEEQPPPTRPGGPGSLPARAHSRNLTLYIVGGGVAAFLLIGVGVLLSSRGTPSQEQDRPKEIAANDPDDSEPAPPRRGVAPASPQHNAGKVPAGDPRQAVFRLEMQAVDGKLVQLGTAWAVGPRRLVTTGDAARGIALNQEFFPTALARHSLTHESIEITKITLHPQYEAAASRLDQAVRRIEQLKSDYEETKDPSERRELEDLARQKDQAALLAAEEAVNVNVAVLDIGKDLSGALSWVDAPAASAKVGQKLTLVGHPLSAVDVLVDPDHPVPPEQRVGRLRHIQPSPDSQVAPRWLVSFDDPLKEQNWSGSPVLDSNGVVVGVYSRPTPPTPGSGTGSIVTHDVTVVESLKALLSGNGKQP